MLPAFGFVLSFCFDSIYNWFFFYYLFFSSCSCLILSCWILSYLILSSLSFSCSRFFWFSFSFSISSSSFSFWVRNWSWDSYFFVFTSIFPTLVLVFKFSYPVLFIGACLLSYWESESDIKDSSPLLFFSDIWSVFGISDLFRVEIWELFFSYIVELS